MTKKPGRPRGTHPQTMIPVAATRDEIELVYRYLTPRSRMKIMLAAAKEKEAAAQEQD